ncbi:hypothetical protein BCR36DRAFT_349272 [Piromyces finnis]|uniref:PIN domain-containing protein n=1 Tax=Piromyces finnis TaxID=1754191 RepID=A0A1Y1VF78_9FUNG|nr:hypothetical protein BCR36DRAFT_349272 [Piromyces finnis]|eukprot:ORX53385.1 hypothetical protein BCR36DRAFT_349272 [Piromyces finnis]
MNNLSDSESKLKSSIEYISLTIKNYENQLKTKSNDPKLIKSILIELNEKLLSLDLEYAISQDTDNKLWNLFYSEVEYWRTSINKSNRRNSSRYIENNLWKFHNYLDKIISYYKLLNLKLVLNKKYNKNQGIDILKLKEPKKINRNSSEIYFYTVHKNLIFLGDILRYKMMYNSSEVKDWEDALSSYKKAYTIFPDNGKPHAQIAMIETYRYNYLSMIYWYLLSYMKFYPHPIAKDNLETFFKHILEKSHPAMFINPNIKELLLFFKIIHEERNISRDFKSLYIHQSNCLSDIINDRNIPLSDRIKMIKEIYIILIAYINLMNDSFKATESASIRQNIRKHQAICIILLFENLASNVISLNKVLKNDDNLTNFLFNNENNENNIIFQLLIPISLCCIWIANNNDMLLVYESYTKFYEENEKSYKNFKVAIFDLVNYVSSISEFDDTIEYLPEDCELLGFLPLRNYYSSMDFKSVNQILNKDKSLNNRNQFYIRLGRIQTFIKFLVQKYPEKYKYDETLEKYIIYDDEYKKKEKSRISKMMAQERLKKQVEDLKEIAVKQMQPYVIVDENIILNDLPLLKRWISSETCKIVIPVNVINIIDIQKNGNAKINTRAREAIRFLEQYSIKPNKYLNIQKKEENCIINYEDFYIFKDQKENEGAGGDNDLSTDDDEEIKNIFEDTKAESINNLYWNENDEINESIDYCRNHKPSRKYRSFIECINYYNKTAKTEIAQITKINNNIEDMNESISPLILVTNNRILLKYCEIYNIDCKCMILQDFIKFMAVKRQEKRKNNNSFN